MNFLLGNQASTLDSLSLRGVFREEVKWLQRIRAAATLTDPVQKLSIHSFRYRVLQGVLLSLLSPSWRRVESAWVFISIEIGFGVGVDAQQKMILADKKLSAIISGRSLKELDALYFLLHYKSLLPRVIRKLLIAVLIKWLQCNLPYLSKNIFFVRQDYYGKSSIIVTLARFFPLKIVAIQHGLLTYKELEKAKIYPNSRVGIEAVYNSAYVDKIGLIKPAGSLIYNLGPFLDYRASLKNKENGRALIFISSGDLGNLEDVSVIRRLNEISCATGCQFLLRLHPTERRQMRRDDLSSLLVNIEPKLKLLDRDINK